MASVAVLIPVKAFDHAKERLAPALSRPRRAALARELATGVVRACAPLAVTVVCDDHGVARWARELGASIVWRPGSGLNDAVAAGVRALAHFDEVIVAHGDLSDPRELTALAQRGGITLVPDTSRDGTNVIVLPPRCGFRFAYGPQSFSRHAGEAARTGLPVHIVDTTSLSYDVDTPADLDSIALTSCG